MIWLNNANILRCEKGITMNFGIMENGYSKTSCQSCPRECMFEITENKITHIFNRIKEGIITCSFCNKSNYEVEKLIAAPGNIYICNECIELCNELINEKDDETEEIKSYTC